MNEEFAIEPDAFADIRQLRMWIAHFGFSQGRFIAQFPSTWRREVISLYQDELHRKAALRLLKRDDRPLASWSDSRTFREDKNWVQNAALMRATFTDVFVAAPECAESKVLAECGPEVLPPSREYIAPERAETFVRVCGPIVKVSDEIVLVDPYFDIGSTKCARVLAALLEYAATAKGACRRFVLWVRESEARITQAETRRVLSELARDGQKVVIAAVRDGRQIHDRVLISRYGGLKFSRGFQEGRGTTEIHYLDVAGDVYKHYVRLFLSEADPFPVAWTVSNCADE